MPVCYYSFTFQNLLSNMRQFERITQNPAVMAGKPCIRGLRMPVSVVVSHVARGRTTEEILTDFPYLEREDIEAAVNFKEKARASQ